MSLVKLLKAPIKLFKKEVITFVIIRRYDLGILEENLRYIAVKPSASVSVLRQKVWHLLDLPDFCEEIIVLKSTNDVVIPLVDLRKGNDPQCPYILEVWLPNNRLQQSSTTVHNNMLTIGNGDEQSIYGNPVQSQSIYVDRQDVDEKCGYPCFSQTTISNETMALNKLRIPENKMGARNFLSDFNKKSDLSCRISSTSIFKLSGRKSRENFTNILLKIQSDLSTLSNKLSVLENKLPS
uniref:Uncharacterized protein n=1 Tax=Heliothis virescens TaxID=7102 RepID=A0A2A4JFM7_HELVI